MKLSPVALVLAGVVGTAAAGTPYEVPSGPAIATGGAAAAHAHDNSAITVNPAAIALTPRYGVAAFGGYFDGRDLRFGGSAVDGQTTPGVALGVAYQRAYLSSPLVAQELPGWVPAGDAPPTGRRFDTLALALAAPVVPERLSLGLAGNLVVISHPILGSAITGNLTAGLAGRPARRWAVGLAGRNLLPVFFPTDPGASVVLGNRYAWTENQALSLDLELPLAAIGATSGLPVVGRFGAEWGDDQRVLGVGYRFVGPTSEHWLTLGFGAISAASTDPRASAARGGLHYAAELPLHGLDGAKSRLAAIRHTVTITIQPDFSSERRDRMR